MKTLIQSQNTTKKRNLTRKAKRNPNIERNIQLARPIIKADEFRVRHLQARHRLIRVRRPHRIVLPLFHPCRAHRRPPRPSGLFSRPHLLTLPHLLSKSTIQTRKSRLVPSQKNRPNRTRKRRRKEVNMVRPLPKKLHRPNQDNFLL
jgi:hypothetical protein